MNENYYKSPFSLRIETDIIYTCIKESFCAGIPNIICLTNNQNVMKSFEVTALGLEEIKNDELIRTNGGFWGWVFGVIAGGIVYDLISNPKHNSEIIAEGKNDAMNMY